MNEENSPYSPKDSQEEVALEPFRDEDKNFHIENTSNNGIAVKKCDGVDWTRLGKGERVGIRNWDQIKVLERKGVSLVVTFCII